MDILFRGKTEKGKWVSGGSIIQFLDNWIKSYYIPQFEEKCHCNHDDETDDILSFKDGRFYKIIPSTIGQYIGILDKNDTPIFTGDIIKMISSSLDGNTISSKITIESLNDFDVMRHICHADELEVIGNIHEPKGVHIEQK